MVTLTRKFTFEMAHALEGYNGACRHIHGHSYKLLVSVAGRPSTTVGDPKLGMVMDFSELKGLVNSVILDVYDHSLVLKNGSISEDLLTQMRGQWSRIIITDFQPTCENMIVDMFTQLSAQMPAGVRLSELQLYETENSCVTYRGEK